MTAGRKPSPAATLPDNLGNLGHEALQSDLAQVSAMAGIADAYSAERDIVNQLLGQAQMADAISKFSRTVRLSKLAYVRENKLYRALAGKKTPNGSALSGTWEEFCELLGHSKDKIDLDIRNLQAFGEEALESMSRMGIGYRELRQYRKLPEDKRLALIEVAKTGDKDSLLDLAEDFIAENTKKSDELAARVSDLEGTVQAQERLLADKNAKIDELATRKGRVRTEAPDEVLADLRRELTAYATEVEAHLAGRVMPAVRAIQDHHAVQGGDSIEALVGALRQIERMTATVRVECGLPLAGEDIPLPA